MYYNIWYNWVEMRYLMHDKYTHKEGIGAFFRRKNTALIENQNHV